MENTILFSGVILAKTILITLISHTTYWIDKNMTDFNVFSLMSIDCYRIVTFFTGNTIFNFNFGSLKVGFKILDIV